MGQCRQPIDKHLSLIRTSHAASVDENLSIGGQGVFPVGNLSGPRIKHSCVDLLGTKAQRTMLAV